MKKTALSVIAAFILLAVGCKLDEPDFSKVGPGNGPSADSYQPFTTGSYWKYNQVSNGIGLGVEKHTLTGATQTINNKKYYVLNVETTLPQSGTVYFSYDNGDYRTRQTAAGVTVEHLYLKDSYAVNQTWSSNFTDNGSINGVPAKATGKIIEKGITKVVSGKTFTDVIHTQMDLQYDYGAGFTHVQTVDFYVAKGVGIIETDSDIQGFKSQTLLIEYSIK